MGKIQMKSEKFFVSCECMGFTKWMCECERVVFDEWTGNRNKLSRATTDYSQWIWMILHITLMGRTMLCWHHFVRCFFAFAAGFFGMLVHRELRTNYFFSSFIIFYQAYLFWNISVRYEQYLGHALFQLDQHTHVIEARFLLPLVAFFSVTQFKLLAKFCM